METPGVDPEVTTPVQELLDQQTATGTILRAIAASPTDIQPVLKIVAESAARLCKAYDAVILLQDGDFLAVRAHYGQIPVAEAKLPIGRDWVSGQAFLDRRPYQVEDLQVADEFPAGRDSARRQGHRTTLAIPLLRKSEAIGVLTVRRREVQPFSQKQIELVATFADQAVIAIENVRLFEIAQTQNRELSESLEAQTATSAILRAIATSPTKIQPVLDAVVESAARLCNAYDAIVFIQEGDSLLLRAHYGPIPIVSTTILISRDWVSGRAFLDGKQYHIEDIQLTEEFPIGRDMARRTGYRTILAAPLLREGKSLGVISLRRLERAPFNQKQIDLLTTFADQAVIAIENVRLFEVVQARTRELQEALDYQTATSDVLNVISRSPTQLQPVLDVILETAVRLCEGDHGTIARERDGGFVRSGHFGFPEEERLGRAPVELNRGTITGRALVEGKPVHVLDAATDPEYTWAEALQIGGLHTILGVPLLRNGKPIGAIAVGRRTVRAFTEKQIELLTTFADQAVIAIENARLFEEVQARTRDLSEALQQQTATADVLKVISRSTFDLKTVLQTLVELAAKLCDADKGTISRQIGGVFYRSEAYGFSDEYLDLVRKIPVEPEQGSALGRALIEGKTIHIADVLADPEYKLLEVQRVGNFRTILGVPMLREEKVIGVLALTRSQVRPFTEKQIELVSTFADQAAIAIENVRLFENVEARTRELAKSLEELRSAQSRLVQTEKLASLGQLTAGIAHEIKNPLNFVNNFAAVSVELIGELRDEVSAANTTGDRRSNIDEILTMLTSNLAKVSEHGKRADSIVKNMLLHARQGSGEHRLVDINFILEESLNLAYHGARAESQDFNVTIERSLDPLAGLINLYPQEMTRVFLNLISNGFYATKSRKIQMGGDGYQPTLSVFSRNLGDEVEIRIRDNGTGIPAEVRDKIFNPFFTTKPAGEGTGLGLSLSYDIVVKQHSGRIEVETEPGEYTEFIITLPWTEASNNQAGDSV